MIQPACTIVTQAPDQTEALGKALARLLPAKALVTLRGDLATGKTCLVRGMASHFVGNTPVTSPTFTLVNEYGDSPRLYHLDLYRLDIQGVLDLGYEELFDPDGVTVVEWAERAEGLFPPKRLDVLLAHAGRDMRELTFIDHGLLPQGWEAALRGSFQ